MYFTQGQLQPYLDARLLSEQIHPDAPNVRLYNYTASCQYEKAWDVVTLHCRGLILDRQAERVLANPFPKFFNYGETDMVIPDEPPEITEKLDGSLGILFWLNDQPWIATRGSFVSEQAQWATRWVREHVKYNALWRDITYLGEIIYPENRIVVQYPFSGWVLLAARDTFRGEEYSIYGDMVTRRIVPRVAQRVPHTDLAALARMDEPNSEGFVVHWHGQGLRIKIKFQSYLRLHRIMTGLSEKAIWECLSSGQDISQYIQDVPDEFYRWFEGVKNRLLTEFQQIWTVVDTDWQDIQKWMVAEGYTKETHRKEIALTILKRRYPSMLFSVLDGKPFNQAIWKLVQPSGATAFHDSGEEV